MQCNRKFTFISKLTVNQSKSMYSAWTKVRYWKNNGVTVQGHYLSKILFLHWKCYIKTFEINIKNIYSSFSSNLGF